MASITAAQAGGVTKITLRTQIGSYQVYAAADGHTRIEGPFGTMLFATEGSAYSFNDESKMYFEYKTPMEFQKSAAGKGHGRANHMPSGAPWIREGMTEIQGAKGIKFVQRFKPVSLASDKSDEDERQIVYRPLEKGDEAKMSPQQKHYIFVHTIVATADLPLPQQWIGPYCKAVGAGCPSGFPLLCTWTRAKMVETELTCLRYEKNVLVPPDFFAIPKGYRRTRDEFEVFLGGSGFASMMYKSKD